MDNKSRSEADEDTTPSLRLLQILRTYARGLDPTGLADLRRSVHAGRFPWLRTDLTAALTDPDLPATWWHESIREPADTDGVPPRSEVEAAQRRLWQTLFPADPFPQPTEATT